MHAAGEGREADARLGEAEARAVGGDDDVARERDLEPAAEGLRLGFVNEVVPATELIAAAERWASEILECSPLLVQLTKEAAHDGLGRPVEDAMARDWEERIPRLLASEDYVEGPRAFSEKRRPAWTGR